MASPLVPVENPKSETFGLDGFNGFNQPLITIPAIGRRATGEPVFKEME
jgi:hypothetical protein